METVEAKWNVVVRANSKRILDATNSQAWLESQPNLFGNGDTAYRIVEVLSSHD